MKGMHVSTYVYMSSRYFNLEKLCFSVPVVDLNQEIGNR
jgi:hypothetical protein